MREEIRRVTAGVDGAETRQDASSTTEDRSAVSMPDGMAAGLPAVGSAKAGGRSFPPRGLGGKQSKAASFGLRSIRCNHGWTPIDTAEAARSVISVILCLNMMFGCVHVQAVSWTAILEQKTGKAGGLRSASFVSVRVHSWFHHPEPFCGMS